MCYSYDHNLTIVSSHQRVITGWKIETKQCCCSESSHFLYTQCLVCLRLASSILALLMTFRWPINKLHIDIKSMVPDMPFQVHVLMNSVLCSCRCQQGPITEQLRSTKSSKVIELWLAYQQMLSPPGQRRTRWWLPWKPAGNTRISIGGIAVLLSHSKDNFLLMSVLRTRKLISHSEPKIFKVHEDH